MDRPEPSQRLLLSGLIVSVMAHAALWMLAMGLVRVPVGRAVEDNQKVVPVAKRPVTPVVKLGIDDSAYSGVAWLGFKEPTPHQGLPASVDQSAMTPAPGSPQPAAAGNPPKLATDRPVPRMASERMQEAAQALSEIGPRLAQTPRPQPESATGAAPAQPTNVNTPGAAGGKAGEQGLASDKEAVGTSVKNAPQVRLGQVAAVNGLDIQTKKPRFSTTTLLTVRPANPTIEITFGADGKVVRASFAREAGTTYSTGSSEVDEPLLSAVYSWVARGKRLAELTSKDPKREVTILITVLFNG